MLFNKSYNFKVKWLQKIGNNFSKKIDFEHYLHSIS